MSYCRWSSDNWKCDLYCYEGDKFITHIAGRRRVGHIPDDRLSDFLQNKITPEEYTKLHKEQMKAVKACGFEDITLPHAGETFEDEDLESFKERLLYLREVGYRFPDYVLEQIDEEMAEEKAKNAATEKDHTPR